MRLKGKYKILPAVFIICLLSGFLVEYLYHQTLTQPFSAQKFNNTLHHTISKSDRLIASSGLPGTLHEEAFLQDLIDQQNQIAFYIFEKEQLTVWNTNRFDVEFEHIIQDERWHYIKLPNAYGIYKWYNVRENAAVVAFIPVRMDFPYENDYLQNDFHPRFDINKNVTIVENKNPGAVEVSTEEGDYLFSLIPGPNDNKALRVAGFIIFSFSFLLFIFIYFNINHFFRVKRITQSQYVAVTLLSGLTILICSYADFPGLFFSNQLFSPNHYATNQLIDSFTHLSAVCLFLVAALLVYHLKVNFTDNRLWLKKSAFYLYILFYFETLKSIVLNSNISFNIAILRDIHFINIWAQTIIFLLGTGIFFFLLIINRKEDYKTKPGKSTGIELIYIAAVTLLHALIFKDFTWLFVVLLITILIFDSIRRFFFKNKFTFNTFGLFIFIISIISFFSSYYLSEHKKLIKYKIQAENILVNGNADNDPIAELLLEELDKNLRKDEVLKQLMLDKADTDSVNKHIYQKHLYGFWNKYNVQIYPVSGNAPETDYYVRFLEFTGKRLKNTGFYSLPASLYDMSFIGLVDLVRENPEVLHTEKEILVFEFQPKRNFRSYSFPDLLISKESDAFKQSNISIAKYEKSNLIYSDQKFGWNESDILFHGLDDGFTRMSDENREYYVYTKNDVWIVITEIVRTSFRNLIFYSLFIILAYLLFARVVFWLFGLIKNKRTYALGLTSKFQLVFISLLFVSFISILIFSVNYIRSNYRQEQIAELEKKKQYIRNSLQDLYYWTEDIATVDEQSLNTNLQELAYRYQTDINIYDNAGKLRGSSQSLIFSKNLISGLMSPEVYFPDRTTENQYEQIGKLAYLAAYSDLINGDYLQIGYISIPQYFSQTEINAKIEQFLGAIIQIYLIIIILSIILILIAGRQLAEPLHQLESKLKSMRLGGKNEKIEYKSKDEIGQLVEQYNRTVDELEKSAQLLLTAERESAWRTMARQVAHEINNPLTPMKLTIQQLQRTKKLDPEQFDGYFEKAAHTLVEQIDNLSRIAGTFSQFARMPETKFTDVDIAGKLVSVVNLFQHNYENIRISYTGPEKDIIVSGDPEQIIQVFNNILKNATQSIKKGVKGKIDVTLEFEEETVIIRFTDNGAGISETIRNEIFKPNFTTKSAGMGLGLSISKSIIEHMGGHISFITKQDEGTTFEIRVNRKSNK